MEKLGNIIALSYGKPLKKGDRKSGKYPVYGSNGIVGYHNDYLVEGPTVIVGRKGSVGKVHYSNGPCWPIDTTYFVESKVENLDYYWLTAVLKALRLDRLSEGAGVPGLNRNDAYEKLLALPTAKDQRRIATLLRHCEQLIQWRKESIALLDDYVRSVFMKMFGDPLAMSKLKLPSLKEYVSFLTSGSRGWAKYYTEDNRASKFLRIQNVGNGELKSNELAYVNAPDSAEAKRTRLQANDLLVSITADLGRTAVIPEDFGEAYISQHLALVRLKKGLHPLYLAYYVSMPFGYSKLQRSNKSNVKAGLNFDDIKSLPVFVPNENDQNLFVKIVEEVNALRELYQESLTHLQNLYHSYSQRAFRGKLDLSKLEGFVAASEPGSSNLPLNPLPSLGVDITVDNIVQEAQGSYQRSTTVTKKKEIVATEPTLALEELLNEYPTKAGAFAQVIERLGLGGLEYEELRDRLFEKLDEKDSPLKQYFTPPGLGFKLEDE